MTDWESEGLLEGLDEDARAERIELLDYLHDEEGVSLQRIKTARDANLLLFVPAERVVGGEPIYTEEEVVERSGLPPDLARRLQRASGLPIDESDTPAYSETDLETLRFAARYLDAGVDPEDQVAISRALGRGLAGAAEIMRQVTLKLAMGESPGSERELAERFKLMAEALTPMTGPMLENMLKVHLRQMLSTEAASASERHAGTPPGARDVTIAFADLVGFTRLGERVAPDELGRVADRLETLALDAIESPVRVVKTIGDAVMFAATEPAPLLATTLRLLSAAEALGDELPQLRVGLALGPALSRAGDFFGQPVNLASRITAVARPSSILTTEAIHDRTREDFAWSYAGARKLKGIPGEVKLYRARALETE